MNEKCYINKQLLLLISCIKIVLFYLDETNFRVDMLV